VVVTFAPRLEVEDTDSDVALVIAAFRSKIPVILIAPKVCVPPKYHPLVIQWLLLLGYWSQILSELTVVSNVI
jgi:hypothetical protein